MTTINQILLDSTNRVLIGMNSEAYLLSGYVQVSDAIYAQYLAATSTVYYSKGVLTSASYSVIATQLADQIDAQVADIYSQWTRFQQEYLLRENAADAYKAAGYTGDCSIWITAFASAAGISNQAATDTILSQAVALNGALVTLGALRMRKYEILAGKDQASVQASYDDISGKIKAVAAQIT
jgi:hypothetical protein